MFLLFGTRASQVVLSVVTFVCGYCGRDVPQEVVKSVNRLTLFFVPLFQVSARYFVECSNCRGVTRLDKQQADNSVAYANARRNG